ncbi:sensor histidine kinase [Paucibacter sp. DJ2R-2]|uniref:sensor histidine kinase n=1 Tax=Paucibacter sp. DJ2R-2 TaxID=2893558 RepID=UPI0021E4EE48|nr:PAS domain-containing sensor histidine kinase [Paucibacter sp. DJ2R-2]MCV2420297.1 PAS domain-containing sensor histidine kinase [Paucibacter sp. DJ4R-1]MCV2436758.1 PAS domain-containing sensor histidine kinase [Paucibacter sp. DJ2R-2]
MNKAEPAQSWFGPGSEATAAAAEGDADTESRFGGLGSASGFSASGFDELQAEAASAPAGDSPDFFFQQGRRLAQAGGNAFGRLYRAFLAARAALGLVLVATQVIAGFLGSPPPRWTLGLCLLYAAEALALWLLPRLQRGATARSLARVSSPQWWASIGLDLGLFGLLHAFDRLAGVNYGALFVLPVLMAGVLTPRLLALATAAVAALLMLAVSGWAVLEGADVGLRMTQAGLVGSGFFVVSLLASELASRLAREERAARGSMELARQQAQLNRLVIDEMQEGVLVVDRRGRVRAANPAARILLADAAPLASQGVPGAPAMVRKAPFQLRGVPAWQPLEAAVEQAFTAGNWPELGRDISLSFASGWQRSLRLRMRFTRRREPNTTEDLCVLLIEDNRQVQARSQQEKLAAMGRVSAGIAHEIRNPLAAIDQANALLAEDLAEPRAQQLTRMVASNVQRLKRIVEDVLEVAPGAVPTPVPVDASTLVNETCLDWARTNQLAPGPLDPLSCIVPLQPLIVSFDPEHLRRVLVNLLDNALRHADPGPASVQVHLDSEASAAGPGWARLLIFNAGRPIAPEVERHLFEPFFSTRSRGSGLGLYICRELCERYGARIDYQRRHDEALPGNEFVLRLRLMPASSPANLI